ncbi:MAG: prepilin-type N-terminal cleavage/methylation domain-containing protein [Phycisphaerales bacterium]
MSTPLLTHVERRERAGFTLIELLVALAAVALLALGIAEIFKVTGKTVAAGRRLSNLTSYGGLIERQFRSDFAGMTRDGFLVIRNFGADSNANARWDRTVIEEGGTFQGTDRVRLSPQDESAGRTRRMDDIVFFSTGNFASVRDPRHPDRVARSSVARVYYGIGERQTPGAGNFEIPRADDDFDGTGSDEPTQSTGRTSGGSGPNPNRFASDMILLRQAALMCPPRGTDVDSLKLPLPVAPYNDPGRWSDSIVQHALQPAAPSIFRRFTKLISQNAGNLIDPGQMMRIPAGVRTGNAIEVPTFESGLVDIAATDLGEVRSVVMGALPPDELTFATIFDRLDYTSGTPAVVAANLERMQQWMIQAFPADFDGLDNGGNPDPNMMRRVRCESTPPNYLGFPNPTTQRDYERVDQSMLTAFNFVPHCTEFIVEWTFGQTDNAGRTRWHGMNREIDLNLNGKLDIVPPDGIDRAIGPYGGGFNQQVRLRDGSTTNWTVSPGLIHPPRDSGTGEAPLYSCFGYVDPRYAPSTASGSISYDARPGTNSSGQVTRVYNSEEGDALNAPETIPWAWPTLIRVTITIADPTDPLVERVFQFVLPVPGNKQGV